MELQLRRRRLQRSKHAWMAVEQAVEVLNLLH